MRSMDALEKEMAAIAPDVSDESLPDEGDGDGKGDSDGDSNLDAQEERQDEDEVNDNNEDKGPVERSLRRMVARQHNLKMPPEIPIAKETVQRPRLAWNSAL